MRVEMPTRYDPKGIESKWYEHWVRSGYFNPDGHEGKKPYCITIPPPNVTGELHMGHCLNYTIQDILVRWKRMQGYRVLCLPGTDHAGIATQMKVEESLAKEGLTKHELGREGFLSKVWEWKERYRDAIVRQFKSLGYSFDWSRERFTMDPHYSRAVREAFVELFNKGYVYRDKRIINWCPRCQTAISDIEVEYVEREGKLYYIRYPGGDGSEGVVVATTRPETMLGDVAVAVHPEDPRYKGLVGKEVILPIVGRRLPVIADEEWVDPSFGTGAVKVTPAHDPADFEMGRKHGLPGYVVIGFDGRMTKDAGERYAGLDAESCRELIVSDLERLGYLEKVESYVYSIGRCDRCKTTIEPMISEQWFIKMKDLAKPAIKVVEDGRISFVPERWKKVYLDWMENIRDWCVSRQLWWGHRIPVWTCSGCGKVFAAKVDPSSCPDCGSEDIEQDPDVLDTWFSSGLWPFATLGWPEETEDLRLFYPTSVLVTDRGIIHLWVARMIMMGMEFMKDIPFPTVYIHGTVFNAEGKRMSKTLGTGVDPLEYVEKYGADATRFGQIVGAAKGQDIRFSEEKLDMARDFANKIWNASRFVLMNTEDLPSSFVPDLSSFSLAERWILSEANRLIEETTSLLEDYELSEAGGRIYEFTWGKYCDWYIEMAKARLRSGHDGKMETKWTLRSVLEIVLLLLHPFMPFITEEIWSYLPGREADIMVSPWPEPDRSMIDEDAEGKMGILQDVVREIRAIRAEMGISPSRTIPCILRCEGDLLTTFAENSIFISSLAKVDPIDFNQTPPPISASAVVGGVEIFLPLHGFLDLEARRKKVLEELGELELSASRIKERLMDEEFLSKAPADVVSRMRKRLEELEGTISSLKRTLRRIERLRR
jgi:valyl-tRNA synthetase